MRLIDADALYEYIDDKVYTCDTYAEVKDILNIIKEQPTVNPTKVSPNLTNKGFMQKSFPKMNIDLNYEHKGYVCGYRNGAELRPIIWLDKKWLKEKYNVQYQNIKTKKCK